MSDPSLCRGQVWPGEPLLPTLWPLGVTGEGLCVPMPASSHLPTSSRTFWKGRRPPDGLSVKCGVTETDGKAQAACGWGTVKSDLGLCSRVCLASEKLPQVMALSQPHVHTKRSGDWKVSRYGPFAWLCPKAKEGCPRPSGTGGVGWAVTLQRLLGKAPAFQALGSLQVLTQ